MSSDTSRIGTRRWDRDREPPGTWDEILQWHEVTCDHNARAHAGRWAISRLRQVLGEGWLPRAIERADEGYPLALLDTGSHLLALAEVLEWALHLELIMDMDGRGKALRDLRRDPSLRRLLHSQAQLLLAGLARRLNWQVALETTREGQPPADVEILTPTGTLNVETRVLTQSDEARREHAAMNQTSEWLLSLGWKHSIWIGGKLHRHPTERQQEEIAEMVQDNAPAVHRGATVKLSMPGIELEFAPTGNATNPLHSPSTDENLFRRMVGVIAEKAEKMSRSGAGWLHLTTLTGLWAFTPWAQSPLEEQLATMTAALETALGENKPDGIVLCSAAGMNRSGITDQSVITENGIALRRVVNPVRTRGTLIMSLNSNGQAALSSWQALAEAETDWLDWALKRHSLPNVAELLSPSTV